MDDPIRPVHEEEAELRAAGFRPVVIWVPDTSSPGFTEECRLQARLIRDLEGSHAEAEAWWEISDATGWTD